MSESSPYTAVSPRALSKFFGELYQYGLEKAAFRWYSVYEAEVVSIKDNPDGTARISVVCPLVSDSQIDNVRPIFPNGMFLPPYVGDRVWVMFKQGDVNRPLYVGGWVTVDEGVQPAPEDVATKTEPTTRVIKFKTGALVFEDSSTGKRVELYTKELEGETKRRILSLSDAMQEILISSENGHYVKLNDLSNFYEVFVDTSGGNGSTGHALLLDGDNQLVRLRSSGLRELLFSDTANLIQLKNQLGDNLTIQDNALIRLASTLGVGMTIQPTAGVITIKDVAGNLITISPAGINITSAAAVTTVAAGAAATTATGIAQFSSGGGPVTTFGTGNANSFFVGSVLTTVIGALTAILLGATTITSVGVFTLIGTAIFLGGAGGAALVTAAFFAVYNSHTHAVTSAPGVTGAPTTTIGPGGVPENTVSTQNVKAT